MNRKIYDCFTFFNELDLLEIRLDEHYDHVDHFVIAEANKSHQGFEKKYFLEENWDRYAKYHDKIIYIKVDDMPNNPDTWVLENHQRNALSRGLTNAAPDDIVVISDCDELLRSSTFEILRNDQQHSYWFCRQPIFWGKLNYLQHTPPGAGYNINSAATLKKLLNSPQELRIWAWNYHFQPIEFVNDTVLAIHHAGWHFSYLGDDRQAKSKLENFAHAESRHLIEALDIDSAIEKNLNPIAPADPGIYGKVIIDDYFPRTIIENQNKWEHLIVKDATAEIRDWLPKYETVSYRR
jgi:hypothetical protein